jgi:hypothetical protein
MQKVATAKRPSEDFAPEGLFVVNYICFRSIIIEYHNWQM